MVSADETEYLRDIEKLVGLKIPIEIVEGFEPDPNASTKPIKQGQGGGRRQQKSNKPNSQNSRRFGDSGNSGNNRNANRNSNINRRRNSNRNF